MKLAHVGERGEDGRAVFDSGAADFRGRGWLVAVKYGYLGGVSFGPLLSRLRKTHGMATSL